MGVPEEGGRWGVPEEGGRRREVGVPEKGWGGGP